ncbi:interferon-stimulated 20 kDa exonuclease-like 2 [Pseudophryne corroboree]|uniref:interferon-stimulated 20 kDa exonuclease-like 2 n=1 Tax=Pseudophryne corroboree TaxID=495146 RepID=UPI0030818B7A
MADLVINLDWSSGHPSGRADQGNSKHQRFIKRRRYLENKGFLKQKQLPYKPQNRNSSHQQSWDRHKKKGQLDGSTVRTANNAFHTKASQRQGESTTPHRTVSMGAPYQSGTLSVSISSGPKHSCVAPHTSAVAPFKGQGPPQPNAANGRAHDTKKLSKIFHPVPSSSLLSEFESGIAPAPSVSSYKMVAIDCEMVGTGLKGRNSDLARCSIVNYQGDVVFDKYVKPANPVTDYRTRWSGIRKEHLINATPFAVAQKEILKILNGKIVIGHAIQNDYKAIGYFHPKEMTRDTSKIPQLNRKAGFQEKEIASLKRLAKELLHKNIQTGRAGHSSVEDAKTTMELYRIVEAECERELAAGRVPQ